MIIDLTERVETAKRLTREWAERAGYKQPPKQDATLSKKAHDLQRIMNVSDFGCQQRNVHSLLQVLIGESFPISNTRQLSEYASREPMVIGSVLVPVDITTERAGMVSRLSQAGNAGLRQSNGEMHGSHLRQEQVRPATDDEIDAYFAELFGLAINEVDNPPLVESDPELAPF